MKVNVIGAGLAGSEAALQLAKKGIEVRLWEMKPKKFSPAHSSPLFAELVCSNSLKADRIENACGLLKEEMRLFGSVMMEAADVSRVPAGGALAVDRDIFSEYITKKIKENPLIEVVCGEKTEIDTDEYTIIATGPLTSDAPLEKIIKITGEEELSFFDAAAPVVTKESIDFDKVFYAARYNKGTADYINCPMTEDEYNRFYEALVGAECAKLKSFENMTVFEGCMPIEVMAKRGIKTLTFGPLKPVGLVNPKTGKDDSYAVVQLRQDNMDATLYNLVGFQTNLKFGEQKRVFSMIPGLENAEFVRYGVDRFYRMKAHEKVYFAGQMTGVEGYVESASSGIMAGFNMARKILGERELYPSSKTCIGALPIYITHPAGSRLEPMNANFGIIDSLDRRVRNKQERYGIIARRALEELRENLKKIDE